jgi:hypothetical protein
MSTAAEANGRLLSSDSNAFYAGRYGSKRRGLVELCSLRAMSLLQLFSANAWCLWRHRVEASSARRTRLHPRVPQQYSFGECEVACARGTDGSAVLERTLMLLDKIQRMVGATLAVRLQCTGPALREWSPIRPRLAGVGVAWYLRAEMPLPRASRRPVPRSGRGVFTVPRFQSAQLHSNSHHRWRSPSFGQSRHMRCRLHADPSAKM